MPASTIQRDTYKQTGKRRRRRRRRRRSGRTMKFRAGLQAKDLALLSGE
jgi:hypothetical protein